MIGFGAPGFLLAGVFAALAAVALHLLVRQPSQRAPLPTARFLAATPRASVRVRRTPQDVLLLVVRGLFALLFAAAFARPVWRIDRTDVAHIVVLDRGAGMTRAWGAAVDSARARVTSADGLLLFDTASVWVRGSDLNAAFFDSLRVTGPGVVEADYRSAFRALASVGRVLPAGAYRGTLISVPRWDAWRDGAATSRRAAWPGALELVTPSSEVAAAAVPGGVRVAAPAESALRDAVEALGWQAVDTSAADTSVVRFAQVRARAGTQAERVAPIEAVIFRDGWTAPAERTPEVQADINAAAGDAVAAWRDGAVAAVASSTTTGCAVTTSFTLDVEPAITSPDYPELVRRLVETCHSPASAHVAPLDSGGVALVRGVGDVRVDPGALPGGAPGRSLARPLLVLALLLALAEWPLRQRRRHDAVA